MKTIIVATDSFKGTLSAREACRAVKRAIDETAAGHAILVPIADGGEGTLDALETAARYERVRGLFTDLNGEKSEACYLFDAATRRAVIETAECAGLPHSRSRDPKLTTTYGIGEQIADAVRRGANEILLALGGSGTNDAGCGMLAALGCRFCRADGGVFLPTGGTLGKIAQIDPTAMDETLYGVRFTAMCDVTNPPAGANGATYVYAPQKGAAPADLPLLDRGVAHCASLFSALRQTDYTALAGGGAAGGLGLAVAAMLKGTLRRGIDAVLAAVGFSALLRDAALVITGEGRVDEQSFMGKVLDGIASAASAQHVPVAVVCGLLACPESDLAHGIVAAEASVAAPRPIEELRATAFVALVDATKRLLARDTVRAILQ